MGEMDSYLYDSAYMILHIGIDDILSLQKLLLAEDENKKELIKWLKISENASTQKAQDKTLH